jgi:hypothetical protein
LSRIFKLFVFLIAAIYFLVDVAFFTLAKPVLRWLADCWAFESVRGWIVSLRPYPTLALFIVPVILLEPVKPVAAYLTATGHIGRGLTVLAIGELLKLLLMERLFRLSRDKLVSIPAFAWCYDKVCQGQDLVEALQAWRLVRRWSVIAKHAVQRYFLLIKTAQREEAHLASVQFARPLNPLRFKRHCPVVDADNPTSGESSPEHTPHGRPSSAARMFVKKSVLTGSAVYHPKLVSRLAPAAGRNPLHRIGK